MRKLTWQKAVWQKIIRGTLLAAGGVMGFAAWGEAQEKVLQQTKEYDITEAKMSCQEAHKVTRRALERLHYKVTDLPPTTEKGGTIKGQRMGFWGELEPVSVEISCNADGSHIAPRAEIPPCEQANRVMRKAVEEGGYTVRTFKPASLGGVGQIKGEKDGQDPVSLTISCEVERNRVTVDTSSDSPLLAESGPSNDLNYTVR